MFKPSKIILLFCLLHYGYLVSQTNVDFELTPSGSYTAANAVSGWSVSSRILNSTNGSCGTTAWQSGSPEFSIVTTPFTFPVIGGVGHSPLGGTQVARLNNSVANYMQTRITRTVSVNSSNCLLKIAFAGYWENGGTGHACCFQSGLEFRTYDCSGNPQSCSSFTASPDVGCLPYNYSNITYSYSAINPWTNWQVKYYDLSPYMGSCVVLEFKNSDCALDGNHFGTAFIDVAMTPQLTAPNYQLIYVGTPTNTNAIQVSYCNGSNIATLSGPLGYAQYQWVSPQTGSISPPQGTMSNITIQNPFVNSIYTLQAISPTGCYYTMTASIVSSTVAITALAANTTCINGSSGSATVLASGSSTGYNYQWINQSNSVVATSSVASNLSAGIYSVQVSATGNQACGTDGATLAINSVISNNVRFQSYCNNKAIIQVQGGTGHQWFNGTQPILGPNSTSFTLSPVLPNTVITLTYLTSQNCLDSTRYNLIPTNPGTTYANNNNYVCSGANNGTTTLDISPAIGAPPFFRTFTVTNANTLTPNYTNTLFISHSNSVSIGGLSAGQYSIIAFDGSCEYSNTFTVNAFSFDYQMANNNANICSGGITVSGVVFSTSISPGQYTYSWQPTTFLLPGTQMMQSTFITPTVASGQSTSIVYTMVVTPTVVNCPLTKTLGINVFSPVTPTITSPVPTLCINSTTPFLITALPSGGLFQTNQTSQALSSTGLITPSLSNAGTHTFTYTINGGVCNDKVSGSFVIQKVSITTSGSSTICNGQQLSLSGNGASTYSWITFPISTSKNIVVSPTISTTYSIVGFDSLLNCKSSQSIHISVLPKPVLNILGNNKICNGKSSIFTAQGANTFTWSTGLNVPSISISYTDNTIFLSVAGTNTQTTCTNTTAINLERHTNPTVSIIGDTKSCRGQNVILTAAGADTYTWNGHTYDKTIVWPGFSSGIYLYFNVIGRSNLSQCTSVKSITVALYDCVNTELNENDRVEQQSKIYPNPFSQKLTISNDSPSTLKLFNQLGQLIISKKLELLTETLDLGELEDGIYILQLDNPNQRFSKRIIKSSQ